MAKKQPRLEESVGPLGPEYFRWPVAEGGYVWEDGRPDAGAIGVWQAETASPEEWQQAVLISRGGVFAAVRQSNPLAQHDLFRQFADLRATPDAIAEFASRFGLLAGQADESLDSLRHWQRNIGAMRAAVRVWDALEAGRLADLDKWIWHRGEMPPQHWTKLARWEIAKWALVCRREEDGADAWFYLKGDPNEPIDQSALDSPSAARLLLVRVANKFLQDHCSPYLHPRTFRPDGYVLKTTPKSLLGAMWWQFARLLTGEASHRKCKVCGRLMELSTNGEGFRADRLFCSPACKTKDHRLRVKETKQLRADGKSLRELADHFGQPLSVIKNWLTKKK